MPSEKAKENKTLTVQCSACAKTMSPELVQGMRSERNGRAITVPVCDACRAQGWRPASQS